MSEAEAWFWLVFGGIVFTGLGTIGALLLNATWWIGALIGLGIYLLILLMARPGDGGPTFFFFDV